jgi:hypothetical protein
VAMARRAPHCAVEDPAEKNNESRESVKLECWFCIDNPLPDRFLAGVS